MSEDKLIQEIENLTKKVKMLEDLIKNKPQRKMFWKLPIILFVVISIIFLTSGDISGDKTVFTTGTPISSTQMNSNFDALFNLVNGNIDNVNLASDSASLAKVSGGVIAVSGGNVGVGAVSPSYKLDVNGTFSANSINVNDVYSLPTTDGSNGYVLKTNASGVLSWQADNTGGGLTLPFFGTCSGGSGAFSITNTNSTGNAGEFHIDNTNGASAALYAGTNGLGGAGEFRISNTSNNNDALWVTTNGSGDAIKANISNTNSYGSVIDVDTTGLGSGVDININNTSNSYDALRIITNGSGDAIDARTTGSGYAGYFAGNVYVSGNLSCAGSKPFTIDHPLDPFNKILRHNSIESPEMVNVYKGRAKLENGELTIQLPDYFDALNHPSGREISLTLVNGWSPLYLEGKIENNRFTVKTTEMGNQGQEFSWVIYAVRNDAYAKDHPFIVEQEKGVGNRFKKGELLY